MNINQWFDQFWQSKPGHCFFGDWLKKEKCFNVKVGPWSTGSYAHKFSGEEFTSRREVTYTFPRTTHLYVGPPNADVQMIQLARIIDGNRCVVVYTVNIAGIPFADVFSVETRWTATNTADKVIAVQTACQVVFSKYSLVQGKIKSGTIEESTPGLNDAFKCMQKTCAEIASGKGEEVVEESIGGGRVEGGEGGERGEGGRGGGGGGRGGAEVKALLIAVAVLVLAVALLTFTVVTERRELAAMHGEMRDLATTVDEILRAVARREGGGETERENHCSAE